MRRRGIFVLLFLSMAICGCDSWPPKTDKVRKHFIQNRASFEALEAKLSASKYFDVSRASAEWAHGRFNLDGELIREIIYDDPEWASLFEAAGMWRVRKEELAYVFVPSTPLGRDVRIVEVSYKHYVFGESDLRSCKAEYENFMCGVCAVEIDSDWLIRYMWYPWPETDEDHEKLFGEVVPHDQFDDIYGEYIKKCRDEGLAAIGYESR